MRVITTSLLKSFLNCPIEAYYQEQGLRKPARPGAPLERGSFIHELLDTGKPLSMPAGLFDEELELYESYMHLYEAYKFRWRDADWRRVKSEFKISRRISQDVIYQGKIDELVIANGKLWIVDHKTHVQLPTAEFRLLDIQSDAYIWLLTPWLKKHGALDGTGKYPFGGFVWDYLVINKIKTPQLTVNRKRFKRTRGDELPFTDWTTLRRVCLEEGLATEVRPGLGGIDWTGVLDPDEQNAIEAKLCMLHATPCDAFQRYFIPFDVDQHRRQVAFLKKAIKAYLDYDFTARPMLRNPLLCGNSYLCAYDKLAVAELAMGDDSSARALYRVEDPLQRYNEITTTGEQL